VQCSEDVCLWRLRGLVTSAGHAGVDSGVNAGLELVDRFCYLVDMLSVDRDADAAVETRI